MDKTRPSRIVGIVAACLWYAVPALAGPPQKPLPLAQLFLGGGWLLADTGDSVQSALGPEADIAFTINERVSVFYGFGLHFPLEIDAAIWQNVGGVRVSTPTASGKGRFFVHAFAGGADVDAYYYAGSWMLGGGAGYDHHIKDKIDFRVFKVDLLMTFFGGDAQKHVRVATGVVISLGNR